MRKKNKINSSCIVILIFYNILWAILIPFIFILTVARLIIGKEDPKRLKNKFALNLPNSQPNKSNIIIHAVSGGESLTALELAKSILKINDSLQVTITTHTKSGYEMAIKKNKKL